MTSAAKIEAMLMIAAGLAKTTLDLYDLVKDESGLSEDELKAKIAEHNEFQATKIAELKEKFSGSE